MTEALAFIVLRKWPSEFADQEGTCFAFKAKPGTFNVPDYFHNTVIAFLPTGRFETRWDGSQTEVYESDAVRE